jgi:hypothetical protein
MLKKIVFAAALVVGFVTSSSTVTMGQDSSRSEVRPAQNGTAFCPFIDCGQTGGKIPPF